jgi:CheY-like chemotaxis protein
MSSLKPLSWSSSVAPRSARRGADHYASSSTSDRDVAESPDRDAVTASSDRDAVSSSSSAETVDQSPEPQTTILVVDDEPMLLHIFTRVLETEHEVLVAGTGRQALEMLALRAGEVDVIICDLLMPGMSGMDLYDEVGKLYPDLQPRMVFMSGGASTVRAQSFLDKTPNRTIAKPITLNALELTVAEVIAARR